MKTLECEYFKANGWPATLDGGLKPISALDLGEMRALTVLYAKVLQTEFQSITIPEKRHG